MGNLDQPSTQYSESPQISKDVVEGNSFVFLYGESRPGIALTLTGQRQIGWGGGDAMNRVSRFQIFLASSQKTSISARVISRMVLFCSFAFSSRYWNLLMNFLLVRSSAFSGFILRNRA